MKPDIEKYLKKNKFRLDTDIPDDEKIWGNIDKKIRREKKPAIQWFWKIAVVFLLGVLSTYIIVNETSKPKVVIVSLADVSSELEQQEADLKQIVNTKWSEIGQLSEAEKIQFRFLLEELNDLDKIYKIYEKDLKDYGVNEEIINVLLDYYEKKIRILNRLSLEIEKQKSHENKSI